MTWDEGGVVPDALIEEMVAAYNQPRPFWWTSSAPRRPLTWRQKMRGRWYRLKWSMHDRMFGCHEYDE